MLKSIRTVSFAIAAALAMSGCMSLAPEYERPQSPVAQTWPQNEAAGSAEMMIGTLADWNSFFTDDRLKKLVAMGVSNNRSLRAAVHSVEQARAKYGVSRAALMPTIAAAADNAGKRVPTAAGHNTEHTYSASVAMTSYELDLFGRVRNTNEQALQAFLQTREAQRSAQMTVVTEIAQTWLSLGAAKAQLELADKTLQNQLENQKLIQRSYELGAASLIDVQQAGTTVANARNAKAQQARAVAQYRNALVLLTGGEVPAELEPTGLELSVSGKVAFASNIPSEVLLSRPDIMAAEAALKAANANIGVARANFFPRITLTGALGTTTTELSDLFQGHTKFWSLTPGVSLPIFTGGANEATLEAAKAAREEAVAKYEYAVQNAFREVADALALQGSVGEQLAALSDLSKATAKTYELAQARYRSGADSFTTVLDSQRADFAAQQSLISARLAQAAANITLYKALGGASTLAEEGK